jgi:aminoglycoside phosphotransferase family enzyme
LPWGFKTGKIFSGCHGDLKTEKIFSGCHGDLKTEKYSQVDMEIFLGLLAF